jgi:hypothetical protein
MTIIESHKLVLKKGGFFAKPDDAFPPSDNSPRADTGVSDPLSIHTPVDTVVSDSPKVHMTANISSQILMTEPPPAFLAASATGASGDGKPTTSWTERRPLLDHPGYILA